MTLATTSIRERRAQRRRAKPRDPADAALKRATAELAEVRGWLMIDDADCALTSLDAAEAQLHVARQALLALAARKAKAA